MQKKICRNFFFWVFRARVKFYLSRPHFFIIGAAPTNFFLPLNNTIDSTESPAWFVRLGNSNIRCHCNELTSIITVFLLSVRWTMQPAFTCLLSLLDTHLPCPLPVKLCIHLKNLFLPTFHSTTLPFSLKTKNMFLDFFFCMNNFAFSKNWYLIFFNYTFFVAVNRKKKIFED